MDTPAVQKTAILTLIDPRTEETECRTVCGHTPGADPWSAVPSHLLDFCARHCVAPSDVQVSLSTIH